MAAATTHPIATDAVLFASNLERARDWKFDELRTAAHETMDALRVVIAKAEAQIAQLEKLHAIQEPTTDVAIDTRVDNLVSGLDRHYREFDRILAQLRTMESFVHVANLNA